MISVTHRDDIPAIPAQQRAPTGGACWRSRGGACGFGLVSRASGASGVTARPNYVGPSARAGGADERRAKIPAGSRRPRERLLPSSEGGPEVEGKRRSGAPRGAPVRVMDRQFPPAGGTGATVRSANGCGVPRLRISALRFPLFGIAKGSKPTIWTEARRDAPRGNAPARPNKMHREGMTI